MEKLWKCTVCSYIHQGENPPDFCPKCNADHTKFVELSTEDAQKVYSSDRTNDIHMHMIKDCMKMISLCEEGIKLNLDPNCVKAFEKAKNELWVIKQRAKAELEGHMKKGKW
jgi:predicted secreted Zn-dependent protease